MYTVTNRLKLFYLQDFRTMNKFKFKLNRNDFMFFTCSVSGNAALI